MMNNFEDVNSLSHFKQNPSEAIEQLEKSGKPLVLTEEGKAKIVVQDAKSYQQFLDTIDLAESIICIRKGLDAMNKNEEQSIEEAFAEIYQKHRLSRRNYQTR